MASNVTHHPAMDYVLRGEMIPSSGRETRPPPSVAAAKITDLKIERPAPTIRLARDWLPLQTSGRELAPPGGQNDK